MILPQSEILTTTCLGRIFDKTVATYKFFWFISILQIHAKTGNRRINVWDIVIRMVANAWYPIHYFRLSFGKSDSLSEIIKDLQQITGISIDSDIDTISAALSEQLENGEIKRHLRTLTLNVPYRFLRPWIDTDDNKEMVIRSQTLENGCLYSLHKNKDEFYIKVNSAWDSYLHSHCGIMMDFAYWNLTQFLQIRNPNVPALSNKLIRPEKRNPLTAQHNYWDMVINLGGPIRCIYTDRELYPSNYDLDHFMPWSFVSHNLNWNLIPSDGSVNSSKSNKLPELSVYLHKLTDVQHKSLRICINANKSPKILEDYLSLGFTPQELAEMDDIRFMEIYERTYKPLNQIAMNMGYEIWKHT